MVSKLNPMKLAKGTFLLVFLAVSVLATAQNSKVYVSDAWIIGGFSLNQINHPGVDNFRKLAPGSAILNRDFSVYNEYDAFNSGGSSGGAAGITLKFKKDGEKKQGGPELRLGIIKNTNYLLMQSFSKYETYRIDTLASAQNGTTYYMDSVGATNISMDYYTQQINLDISMIYRSNPESRWGVFGGVGIANGMSYYSSTRINQFIYSYTNTYSNSQSVSNQLLDASSTVTENFRNDPVFSSVVYLPFGIDWRIGKKKAFWMPIHLYYEMRTGIALSAIPEIGTQIHGFYNGNIGLRYTL